MLFGCVVISDVYWLQEVVILNLCSMFSKNLISSFIDKVTTGSRYLFEMLLQQSYYDVLTIHTLLSKINQDLFDSLSMVSQEISKNY